MRYPIEQFRLLLAEKFIAWAVKIAPKDHPDSTAIYKASLLVCSRMPSK